MASCCRELILEFELQMVVIFFTGCVGALPLRISEWFRFALLKIWFVHFVFWKYTNLGKLTEAVSLRKYNQLSSEQL